MSRILSSLFCALTVTMAIVSLADEALATSHKPPTTYSFYWHDVVSTPNATAVPVAGYGRNNVTSGGFGTVYVFDDMLTFGPSPTSRAFGRAQGMFVVNSLDGDNVMVTCTMILNDQFHRGTFHLLGSDGFKMPEREIPVVGGTEDFRYKRGYAQLKTFKKDGISTVLYVRVHLYHAGPN